MQPSITISQPCHPLLVVWRRSLRTSLVGLVLAGSIVGYGISGLPLLDGSTSAIASTLSFQDHPSLHAPEPSTAAPSASDLETGPLIAQSPLFFLDDGTYLYGQVTEPNQVDSAYMVFDVKGQTIVGAFYMPHSSFDCFQGTIQPDELALTVHDSYSQETFPFAVALAPNDEAIAFEGTVVAPPMKIDGFQPLESLSENDQRILATCRADIL